MTGRLITETGDEVTQVGPTLPSGRTLVQNTEDGLLAVVDAATLQERED